MDINFIVDFSKVDEVVPEGIPPSKVVEVLALKKAKEVAIKYQEGLIVGADTIVVLDDKILGKPKDEDESLSMLLSLQNRKHKVYSGIAIVDGLTKTEISDHEVTEVEFRPIDKDEALRYINSSDSPKGKAGSYAIQGKGAIFVKRIDGDYFNVVGLPLFKLANMLSNFGIKIV